MTSSVYLTGTVSVSGGNAVVTGTGTAWSVALVTGGMFSFQGQAVPIASVESDTSLTLAYPWPGATAAGAYAIARETSEAVRAAWINDRLAQILTKLSLAGIHPDGAGTLAERDALSPAPAAGFLWLRVEVGFGLAFYKRTGSGWDGPFSAVGDVGPQGSVGPAGEGFNPAGAWVIGAIYAGGDFVSHSGRTFVSLVDGNVGNTPPVTDADDAFWMFVPTAVGPTGPKGDTGDTGLKGETGDVGATGPANSLAIGTVTGGSAAEATITGSAPSQTLNLVLPKGDTGDQGIQGIQGPPGAGSVDSVNGDPGPNIVLDLDDIGDGATNKAFTSTEKAKLAGVATGATANDTDANLKARANHTGTQSADTITDGTTNKAFTATEQTKLGGIAAGAEVNVVDSVAGKTGAVSLVKGDVGLGNVDNTSDASKPVSTAQQTALDAKVTKANDTGLGGFTAASKNLGNLGSAVTIAPTNGNIQHGTNSAAVVITAPSTAGVYTIIVEIVNSATAGAVTLSGFTKIDGDAFTATNGHKFQVHIAKTNSAVTATVKALQ